MKWKLAAWSCVSFLVFTVVVGPAVLAMIQQNRQQAHTIQQQGEREAELRSRWDELTSTFETSLTRRVTAACDPLQDQLSTAEGNVEQLRKEIAGLKDRCAYQREMYGNLETAQKQISALERQAELVAEEDKEVELRKQLAVLRTRHEQVEERLDALDAATTSDWEAKKGEISEVWSKLASLLDEQQPYDALADTSGVAAKTLASP